MTTEAKSKEAAAVMRTLLSPPPSFVMEARERAAEAAARGLK